MGKIVATFKLNNESGNDKSNGSEYIIYKNEGSFIACKKTKGSITLKLTDSEKQLMGIIFNKLKVKHHMKLSDIEFEGKKYQHFYDKENDFHTFLKPDNSQLGTDEFAKLNYYHNNQSTKVFLGKKEKEQSKDTIQRIVKVGKKIFIVTMLSSMLINGKQELKALANDNKFEVVQEVETYEEEEALTNEEKIANLKDAVKNNVNLTDEEKAFMLSGFDIVEKNIEFIDYQAVLNRINKLYINYINEPDPEGKVAGTYTSWDSCITIYSAPDFKTTNKAVLSHEMCHAYQAIHFDSGLYEVTNAIMNEEYYGTVNKNTDRGYDRKYIIALMEILGNEPFRNYNFTGDRSQIVKALTKIINDESKAYNLIYNLNQYTNVHSTAEKNGLQNEIEKSISDYYSAKYGKPIYLNPYLLQIMYPNVSTIVAKALYEKEDENVAIKPLKTKYYFNEDLPGYLEDIPLTIYKGTYKTIYTEYDIDQLRKEYEIEDEITDEYLLETPIEFIEVIDKDKKIFRVQDFDYDEVEIALTEKSLLKVSTDIKGEMQHLFEQRQIAHDEIVHAEKLKEIEEETKQIKNFGVMKIDDEEKLVYTDKNGNTVINIKSEYVSKINKALKEKQYNISYVIIKDLNVLSISAYSGAKKYGFNIRLSDGEKFKVKKYLRKQGADDSLLDGDSYYLNTRSNSKDSDMLIINIIKHYGGAVPDQVSCHTVIPKAFKDGKIAYKSEYAKEVSEIIKNEFGESFNYKTFIYEPYPSSGCISLIVYNDEKLKTFRFIIGSWDRNPINSEFLVEEEEDNVIIDELGYPKIVSLEDGILKYNIADYKRGK